MSEINKKKRGRPKKEGSRRDYIKIFLTDYEKDMIKQAASISGLSLSEFCRKDTVNAASKCILDDIKKSDSMHEDEDFDDDFE